jgi:hypothetical protein
MKLGRCREALLDVPLSGEQSASQLVGTRGLVYAECGQRQQAVEELHRLEALARSGKIVSHYGFATIYAALGDKARALTELEAAYDDRAWAMFMIRLEPAFESLRNEPRFLQLAQRIGFTS